MTIACWQEISTEALPEQDFAASFESGEQAGRTGSLDEILSEAKKYDGDNRANFLDGASHQLKWPSDIPLSDIAQKIEREVPSPHRDVFHDGVAQGIVFSQQGLPDEVLPRIEEYSGIVGQPLHNGLRIGFWRLFAEDPLQGVAIAQAYPDRYHNPLFEELGWLLGSRYVDELSVGWLAWRDRIPEQSRCSLAHGVARGWWMERLAEDSPSYPAMLAQTRLIEECLPMLWRGVGWAGILTMGENTAEWRKVEDLLSPEERQYARRARTEDLLWD